MRQLETSTLSNQNITSALLTHTYTADADREVFFRLFADQIAGNGDYVAYLTIQRLGAGSAYQAVPITTAPVASGTTEIVLTTIAIPVKDTDVVKVYLTGLGGDTTTPDIITEVWDSGIWDELLTGATHNVSASAGRRLRELGEQIGYQDGAIWIDTVNGEVGTTIGEHGTVNNPVKSIADALTLAVATKRVRMRVASGSTITLGAALEGYEIYNNNWTLVLNGKSVSGSCITGANVSGICTGATEPEFVRCHFINATLPPCHICHSGFGGTMTAGSAGTFIFDNCYSSVAGTSTPIFDFGAGLDSSNLNFRHYSGGIEIQNMGTGAGSYNMSLEGHGQLVINANCSATSTIAVRGHFTISGDATAIAAITFSDNARYDVTQITGVVYPSDAVYFVLESGNDSNAGTSPGAAFLTWNQAMSVATAGDMVVFGPGLHYSGSGGANDFTNIPAGVKVVGQGMQATRVQSTHISSYIGCGANSTIDDMTLLGAADVLSDTGGGTGVVVRRCRLGGGATGIHIGLGAASSWKVYECLFDDPAGMLYFIGTTHASAVLELYNCHWRSTSDPTSGHVWMSNGIIRIIGGSMRGARSADLTQTGGTLEVTGLEYDLTKTSGTITERAVSQALTSAERNTVADVILARAASNPAAKEYTLNFVICMLMNSNTVDNAGFLTVYDTADGEVAQLPLTVDADANPITGVS